MVAHGPGVVAQIQHDLHHGVQDIGLLVDGVLGHQVALDGVAVVDEDHVIAVGSAQLLDDGGGADHGVLILLLGGNVELGGAAVHIGGGHHGELEGIGQLGGDLPGGGDVGIDDLVRTDVVGEHIAGLTLVLALDHVVLGGVDDAVGIVGDEVAAMLVEVGNIVAAAVVAVVVDDHGEDLIIGHIGAVVGHLGDAAALGGLGVDLVVEAVAVDHIVVGQVGGGAVSADIGGGELQPGLDLLAGHGDLVEPVLIAVQPEQVAQDDIAGGDDVGGVAGGQGSGDGQLGHLIVGGIVGGVLTIIVIGVGQLDPVDQVHEGGGTIAQTGGGEVGGGDADGLEHIVVPGGFLIGLQDGLQLGIDGVVAHGDILGSHGAGVGGLVVGDDGLADLVALGGGGDNGDDLTGSVGDHGHAVPVLVAGEDQIHGVVGLDQLPDPAGAVAHVHAGVGHQHDDIGLLQHLGLVVVISLDGIGEVDALPVGGNVPLGNTVVADAHDGDLDAVVLADDIGLEAAPGGPVLALVIVRLGGQVVGHGHGDLALRLGGLGDGVIDLLIQDGHAVVELVVAQDPHIIAHGAQGLDGGVFHGVLFEGEVVGHGSALDGVAGVGQEHVLVLLTHLLDVAGDAGQALAVGAGGAGVGGVVGGVELAVDVGGIEHQDLYGVGALGSPDGGHQRNDHADCQKDGQNAGHILLHVYTLLILVCMILVMHNYSNKSRVICPV